jgi:TolB-like protein/tetratricopeptide (TPR) repeat protein
LGIGEHEAGPQIRLCPALTIQRAGQAVELPKSRKTRALLAYLVLSERPVPRERLCELLWDVPDDSRAALRWSLTKLRPLVNTDQAKRLCADRVMVWFEPHGCRIDLLEVRAAAKDGFEGVAAETLSEWNDALTSGLLVDVDLPDHLDYQSWLTAIRGEAAEMARALRAACGERCQQPGFRFPAIAVLPFANRSSDPDDEYFADGLSEDLITALSSWKAFPVIARNSTFTYKGKDVRIREVGAELGVRYVLEGSVRRSGDRVRITAQLCDAETGLQLWAERIDRRVEDVFALQDEITERVVGSIQPELQMAELKRSTGKGTTDLNAWDYYIRGMTHLAREEAAESRRARELFERACELDPRYAEAWAQRAWTHIRDIDMRSTDDREGSLSQAYELSRHAIALDGGSAVAHLCLGSVYVWRGQLEQGLLQAQRSVTLNPSYALAALAVGNRLDLLGDAERGIAQMERALALNPRDPARWHYMGFLSRAHGARGDHEAALRWAEQARALRPDDAEVCFRVLLCLANLDREDEARATRDDCERLEPGYMKRRAAVWSPYRDEERNVALFAGARRHGLL